MDSPGFTLFETVLGPCAISWCARGILGVHLPEADESRTRAHLLKRHPDAVEQCPPPAVREAIEVIAALLAGANRDLSDVSLDLEGVPDFHRRVYAVARTIPPGATLTYGEVAARLDTPWAARAVGQALGRNPFPIIVPCHRVVAAGGGLGGFSARGGAGTKARLLQLEAPHASTKAGLFAHLPLALPPGRAPAATIGRR